MWASDLITRKADTVVIEDLNVNSARFAPCGGLLARSFFVYPQPPLNPRLGTSSKYNRIVVKAHSRDSSLDDGSARACRRRIFVLISFPDSPWHSACAPSRQDLARLQVFGDARGIVGLVLLRA
jgi:hypothetical protein